MSRSPDRAAALFAKFNALNQALVTKLREMPAAAEDLAEVSSLTETVHVPYPPGTFNNCLKTTESSPIAPGDVSPKFYFASVGNLLTVEPNGDRSELIRIDPNTE